MKEVSLRSRPLPLKDYWYTMGDSYVQELCTFVIVRQGQADRAIVQENSYKDQRIKLEGLLQLKTIEANYLSVHPCVMLVT